MARVKTWYVADNSGMRKHMLSGDVSDAAVGAARDIIPIAQAFAPESDPAEKGAGDGTHYEDHFSVDKVVVTIQDGTFSNPRRAARVVNDAEYAAQVEFGTRPASFGQRKQGGSHGTPARPLGRAGAFFPGGKYRGGNPE